MNDTFFSVGPKRLALARMINELYDTMVSEHHCHLCGQTYLGTPNSWCPCRDKSDKAPVVL